MIWWFLTWGWHDLQKLCTFNSKLTAVAVCDRNHVAWMIIYSVLHWQACSLRSRCSLPLISNVCKAALRCFFWGDQQTQLITRKAFWISFQPDWQIAHVNHGMYSNPSTHVAVQKKDIGTVWQTDLNKSLVLSVAQAMIECFFAFFPLGMAGTVYFLADLLDPKSSKFPAFEI